jgi:signal transduction histidine kinase
MHSTRNILLLDANEQSAREIQRFLKAGGHSFAVNHTAVLKDGIASLRNAQPDLVLVDVQMTAATGFDTLKHLLLSKHIPVILLADSRHAEMQHKAEMLQARDFIVKNKLNLFHLEKIILHTLQINDTETRLDSTNTEFANRQAVLLKMLDKTSAAVIVINQANQVLYASARAYSMLNDEAIQKRVAPYITYRNLLDEEELSLKHDFNRQVHININAINWNGNEANIFVIENNQATENAVFDIAGLQPVLNALGANILIMQGQQILFANTAAGRHLAMADKMINGANLNDFFQPELKSDAAVSLTDLFREKEMSARLKQADGSLLPAKLISKPLSIGEYLLEVCWFIVYPSGSESSAPRASSDAETLSTDNILHLASHDLREPVRTVLNYIQLITDSLKKNNYEQAAEYSLQARTAADRMEKLLSDFKEYISLNNYKPNPVKISFKQVAADAAKQLKPLVDASGAEINIADVPEAQADKQLLHTLLYLLVDNALKFTKKGKKPVIDIGCDKYEGGMLYCVRDNGIGIAKKYHERVFGMFERLNRVDEYPGNGLGLAICQRIIQLHGGKIWVESLPGLGSSFYFTLGGK